MLAAWLEADVDLVFRLLLSSFPDPALAAPADAIPEAVPRATVVESQPDERSLRGDFEVAERVFLVYTDSWPGTLETIAGHVLASGGEVAIAIEENNPRWLATRLVRQLGFKYGDHVELVDTIVDTPWVRDWGPIQLRDQGKTLWLDSDYDDDERERDDRTPPLLGRRYGTPVTELPWALDGGAFISNGAGLCVLTLEYLEEEAILAEDGELQELLGEIGCRVTAVVPTLVAEETKHADMVAQFVGPNRIMIAEAVGDGDEWDIAFEDNMRLDEAELGIRRAARTLGIPLEVVRVPTPYAADGITRSYVNGLHLGDRYLMPSFAELGEEAELLAYEAVQDAHGETPVVPVRASELIQLGGAIHCAALGLFE